MGLRQPAGFDPRFAGRRNVFDRYCPELTGVALRFQHNGDASSLCSVSVCFTCADHEAAVLSILREHAIQARNYYNPLQHLHPYFVANPEPVESADLPVTEDICSRIVPRPVHDDIAHDDVARLLAPAQERSSQ